MTIFAPSAVSAQPCHSAEDAGRALRAQFLVEARRGVVSAARSADSALALAALVLGDNADDVAFADLVDALDAAA